MSVKYDKLFALLHERNIKYSDFLQLANISGNILTRMKREQYVSLESIEKICTSLQCDVQDILEFY